MNLVRKLAAPFALLLFALLCYATVIPTYFLSDDFSLIGRVARQGMFFTWGNSHGGFLRPCTALSYVIDFRLWGFKPIGYHLTNVIWHSAAAYALYLMGCTLLHEGDDRHRRALSFLAACLFVALPCHSESVSWITGRTDVIAVALGLGATAAFLHLLSHRSLAASAIALFLLAGALLTKEAVIAVPPIWLVLATHHWWRSRTHPTNRTVATLALAFVLLLGYFLLRKVTLGHFIGGYGTQCHISIIHTSTVANLTRYAIRTILPALPLRLCGAGSRVAFLAAGFLLGCATITLLLRFKAFNVVRWHLLPVLLLCYMGSLVPVATMRIRLFDTMGERFLYLPSAFACLAIVVLADSLLRRQHVTCAALACLVAAQGIALQWVNTRWITASMLSKQIAVEVSACASKDTVVINLPDNYCGAYVFRNGLQEAATLFVGNDVRGRYRALCGHSLDSLQQVVDVDVTTSNLTVTLPDALRFHEVHAGPYDVRREAPSLLISAVSIQAMKERNAARFLSFKNGIDRPMLRTIEWPLQSNPRERESF